MGPKKRLRKIMTDKEEMHRPLALIICVIAAVAIVVFFLMGDL